MRYFKKAAVPVPPTLASTMEEEETVPTPSRKLQIMQGRREDAAVELEWSTPHERGGGMSGRRSRSAAATDQAVEKTFLNPEIPRVSNWKVKGPSVRISLEKRAEILGVLADQSVALSSGPKQKVATTATRIALADRTKSLAVSTSQALTPPSRLPKEPESFQ